MKQTNVALQAALAKHEERTDSGYYKTHRAEATTDSAAINEQRKKLRDLQAKLAAGIAIAAQVREPVSDANQWRVVGAALCARATTNWTRRATLRAVEVGRICGQGAEPDERECDALLARETSSTAAAQRISNMLPRIVQPGSSEAAVRRNVAAMIELDEAALATDNQARIALAQLAETTGAGPAESWWQKLMNLASNTLKTLHGYITTFSSADAFAALYLYLFGDGVNDDVNDSGDDNVVGDGLMRATPPEAFFRPNSRTFRSAFMERVFGKAVEAQQTGIRATESAKLVANVHMNGWMNRQPAGLRAALVGAACDGFVGAAPYNLLRTIGWATNVLVEWKVILLTWGTLGGLLTLEWIATNNLAATMAAVQWAASLMMIVRQRLPNPFFVIMGMALVGAYFRRYSRALQLRDYDAHTGRRAKTWSSYMEEARRTEVDFAASVFRVTSLLWSHLTAVHALYYLSVMLGQTGPFGEDVSSVYVIGGRVAGATMCGMSEAYFPVSATDLVCSYTRIPDMGGVPDPAAVATGVEANLAVTMGSIMQGSYWEEQETNQRFLALIRVNFRNASPRQWLTEASNIIAEAQAGTLVTPFAAPITAQEVLYLASSDTVQGLVDPQRKATVDLVLQELAKRQGVASLQVPGKVGQRRSLLPGTIVISDSERVIDAAAIADPFSVPDPGTGVVLVEVDDVATSKKTEQLMYTIDTTDAMYLVQGFMDVVGTRVKEDTSVFGKATQIMPYSAHMAAQEFAINLPVEKMLVQMFTHAIRRIRLPGQPTPLPIEKAGQLVEWTADGIAVTVTAIADYPLKAVAYAFAANEMAVLVTATMIGVGASVQLFSVYAATPWIRAVPALPALLAGSQALTLANRYVVASYDVWNPQDVMAIEDALLADEEFAAIFGTDTFALVIQTLDDTLKAYYRVLSRSTLPLTMGAMREETVRLLQVPVIVTSVAVARRKAEITDK